MIFQIVASINWLAVLAATAASFLFGWLWYSKVLFGTAWMQLVGRPADKEANPMVPMIADLALTFVSAFSLALLIVALNITTVIASFGLGIITGVGIVSATMLTNYLFENRPLKLYYISAGFQAGSFMLMCLILGAWR